MAPVEKLKDSVLKNVLILVALFFAALFIYFGGNLCLTMINGLSKQLDANVTLTPDTPEVYALQGIVFLLTAYVFFKKV